MKQALAKATVIPLDAKGNEVFSDAVPVLFNPTEYSVEYSASYQSTAPPGLNNPITQFVNGNAQVLTMDLLFDTYTDFGGVDVSLLTGRLTRFLEIDGGLHAPPRVKFRWGKFAFTAVIETISQNFTMFLADGTPVRATLSVTFKQYKTIREQLEDPRRNSADKTKRRVFESDDSLWQFASREYGDPKLWRHIARANRIDKPREIEPGTVLTIPPIEDFQEVLGRGD